MRENHEFIQNEAVSRGYIAWYLDLPPVRDGWEGILQGAPFDPDYGQKIARLCDPEKRAHFVRDTQLCYENSRIDMVELISTGWLPRKKLYNRPPKALVDFVFETSVWGHYV